ncbi:MAG: BlaI/MecI/CopY family transcriptional regulator [Armatimonadetes bacterium]|nr:BlaI/MecI/CopY family transcriptional regulator [Armatimonadota bacterium]
MAETEKPKVSVYRPEAQGLQQALGQLEAGVMDVIWDSIEPLCVDEVRQGLAERKKKEAAYTTIMTTLDRLFKKGFLARDRRGKAYYYRAKVTRAELGSNVTKQVIDGLLTTFAEPAISYFVEALGDTDPEKLDSLAALIAKKRAEQAQGKQE